MTIYLVPIEPIDTRYTRQWYDHIPRLLDSAGADVVIIEGDDVPAQPTPGAFLDFGATNIYKSSQLMTIAQLFREGRIKDGDRFLYTDAWNPTVIQLRYMAELLGKKIEIHGMWHAGSYDPQDFLGRLVGDVPWVRNAESSLFYCFDVNWFATQYHVDLFLRELFGEVTKSDRSAFMHHHPGRIRLTGWPMEYLHDMLPPMSRTVRKPSIVFPHRLAPEKQVEIFRDLAREMPEYDWVVCQDTTLTKEEYHDILASASLLFSANLQETYGISAIEGLLAGALPLLPDRLSYSEMWDGRFMYPSEWTENWEAYQFNKQEMIRRIRDDMGKIQSRDNNLLSDMAAMEQSIRKFTSSKPMIDGLTRP